MPNNTIAFFTPKGGVSKTTSAFNISAGLAQRGYRVLCIDLDPQANLTECFKINLSNYQATMGGVLRHEISIDRVIQKVADGLYTIPSNIHLYEADHFLHQQPDYSHLLKEKIHWLQEVFDFVIIDCCSFLNALTTCALVAADHILAPIVASPYSLCSLDKLTRIVSSIQQNLNASLTISGVYLSHAGESESMFNEIYHQIQTRYPHIFFKSFIHKDEALATSPFFGKDIFKFNPESTGAHDYQQLIDEMIKKLNLSVPPSSPYAQIKMERSAANQ